MTLPVHLVFTTCASREQAEAIGRRLVDERLAACATALPGAISVYRWQAKLERAEECLLLLKTSAPALAALERRLHELHAYECPEFVAVEPVRVSEGYAAWVAGAVASPASPA